MSKIRPDAFEELVGEWIGEVGHLHKKIHELPHAVETALAPTRSLIIETKNDLEKTLNGLPAAADKELKRAGNDAIAALSGEVGNIAREIAGNAAAATAAQAKIEAARWQAGALAVGVLAGGIAAAVLTTGFFKIKLTDAQSKFTAIESSNADVVAAATQKLNNELISVRAAAGWAATESGVQVSNCKVPGWKIEEYTNGTSICITKPAEKNLIGKNEDAVWFWIKAPPPEKRKK